MGEVYSIMNRIKQYLAKHPLLCFWCANFLAIASGVLALRYRLLRFLRCYIDKTVKVTGWSRVHVGLNSVVASGTWLNVNDRKGSEPTLIIGSNCFIGRNNFITAGKMVVFGDYCLTAPGCSFIGASHNISDPNMPYVSTGVESISEIRIGTNCFFGYGSIVLGSVIIGYGSVIGAGSVVLKNIPPLSLVVGNPGRIIKRFSLLNNCWVPVKDYVEETLLNEEEYAEKMRESIGYYPLPISAARSACGDV